MPTAEVTATAEACAWCGAALDPADRMPPRLVRCRSCGALTTDPPPTPAELDAAYGDWYRPPAGERRFSLFWDAVLTRSRSLLARRVDEIAPPGPVLDVGAGDGSLLDALRARGREAVGLERSDHREDMLDKAIEEMQGEGEWAAVIFWHSLEHLPHPASAVRAAAGLLADGGILFVALPNAASLQARVFGPRWLHLDLPRHIAHLTSGALIEEVRKAGFAIEDVSYVRGGQIVIGWLDGLVGLFPGHLRLYHSLRRPAASPVPIPLGKRIAAITLGVLLSPVAALMSVIEISLRRGGTVYVEGRRDRSRGDDTR
jgi:SAM-dependent methyltransferase